MSHQIVVPTVSQGLAWSTLRNGLKECIKAATTNAVVYASWPLKYDVGQTVRLLTSAADSDKVHAWIIGVNKAEPVDVKVGGYNLEWDLTIRIWGFLGYDSVYSAATQDQMEEEVRAITQVLYANSSHFGMDITSALKKSSIVQWQDIDVQAFGSGDDVIVAQGELEVTLRENYSGY